MYMSVLSFHRAKALLIPAAKSIDLLNLEVPIWKVVIH